MLKRITAFVLAALLLLTAAPTVFAADIYYDPLGIAYDKPIPAEIYALMPTGDGKIYGGLNDDPAFGQITMSASSTVDRGIMGTAMYSVGVSGITMPIKDFMKPMLVPSWSDQLKSYDEARESFIKNFRPESSDYGKRYLLTQRGGYGSVSTGHNSDGTFAEGKLTYLLGENLIVSISAANAESETDVTAFISAAISAVDSVFGSYKADFDGYDPPEPDEPQNPPLTANPTASTVLVNGKNVAFDAYNINGNNYFKLRDLAYILSGTEKQFDVGWDGANNAISLTSGQSYTVVGGEMQGKGAGAKTPAPTTSKIIKDGAEVSFTAYNIEGNNYFKLRDIGAAFNFGVTWDGAKNTIVIDTSIGYTPE